MSTYCFRAIKWRIKYYLIEPWLSSRRMPARLLYKLFHYFPINKNLILFESEPDFCDNSWALYQFLKKRRPQYRFVWIVKDIHLFHDRTEDRTSFVTRYGKGMHLRTFYYYATARWNFYTHWTFQPYQPRNGQTVVHLCHSTSLKKGKGNCKDYFDFILTTSIFSIKPQSLFMGCDKSKFLPLGSPRNDILVQNISKGIDNPFCPQNNLVNKVILWMPTFRASVNPTLSETSTDTETGLPLIKNIHDLDVFNSELKRLNVVILAKIHHLQSEKEVFKQKFSNFIIITDDQISSRGLQLYQIVGKSDALLSDYSSIMVDYLLVDKPMGFILDDYDEYARSRGFTFDKLKEDILQGYHIYNKLDLLNFIKNVVNEKDDYKEERMKLKKVFHDMENGTNCMNIVKYFNL